MANIEKRAVGEAGLAARDSVDNRLSGAEHERMNERISALELDMAAVKADVAVIRSNYVTKADLAEAIGMLRADMNLEGASLRAEVGALRADLNREVGALRSEMFREIGSLRSEIGALRSEMFREIGSLRSEIGALRAEVFGAIGALRSDMNREIGALRSDMNREIGLVRSDMAAMEATILKWFVATSVTLAGLAFAAARFIH